MNSSQVEGAGDHAGATVAQRPAADIAAEFANEHARDKKPDLLVVLANTKHALVHAVRRAEVFEHEIAQLKLEKEMLVEKINKQAAARQRMHNIASTMLNEMSRPV